MRIVHYRGTGAWLEQLGCLRMHPRPDEVARARHWFGMLTEGLDLASDVLENCTLMLSELVTNAITHGAATDAWMVRVEWWRVGADLRVTVHSPGDCGDVRAERAGEEDESGRGLLLVQALADSWKALPSPYGGTAVSFVVEGALATPAP